MFINRSCPFSYFGAIDYMFFLTPIMVSTYLEIVKLLNVFHKQWRSQEIFNMRSISKILSHDKHVYLYI